MRLPRLGAPPRAGLNPTRGHALDRSTVSAGYTGIVNRRRTRFSALLALSAIFFAQLATAAYACPQIEAALSDSVPKAEVSIPCAEMGMEEPTDSPSLCLEHCKVGQQLVDTHPPVDQGSPALVLVFFVATVVADAPARGSSIEPILARAAAPPVFASSQRLRL